MKLAHIIKVQQNLYASFVDLFLQVTSVLNKKKFEKKWKGLLLTNKIYRQLFFWTNIVIKLSCKRIHSYWTVTVHNAKIQCKMHTLRLQWIYLAFLIFSIHSSVSFVDFPFKWYLCVSSSSNTVSTNRISNNCHDITLYLYWQKIKELTKTYSRILTKIEHSPLNQQCSNNVSQTHPWVLKVSIE